MFNKSHNYQQIAQLSTNHLFISKSLKVSATHSNLTGYDPTYQPVKDYTRPGICCSSLKLPFLSEDSWSRELSALFLFVQPTVSFIINILFCIALIFPALSYLFLLPSLALSPAEIYPCLSRWTRRASWSCSRPPTRRLRRRVRLWWSSSSLMEGRTTIKLTLNWLVVTVR